MATKHRRPNAWKRLQAVRSGASEIDMVINLGMLRAGRDDEVLSEIRSVRVASRGKILKVIVETCLLTQEEKIRICEIVSRSGADFIKTSTGFSSGGARETDILLFKKVYLSPSKDQSSGRHPHAGAGTALLGARRFAHWFERDHPSCSQPVSVNSKEASDNVHQSNSHPTHRSKKQAIFAKTVLMPGDPLRARFIAETFFGASYFS